jgi:hypothetical protein
MSPTGTPEHHRPVTKVKRAQPSRTLAAPVTTRPAPAVEAAPASAHESTTPVTPHEPTTPVTPASKAAEAPSSSPPPRGEFDVPRSSTSRQGSAASASTPAPATGPGEFGP